MPPTVKSLRICLNLKFHMRRQPKENLGELISVEIDQTETHMQWVGAATTRLSGRIHPKTLSVLMRFLWVFVAYKSGDCFQRFSRHKKLPKVFGDSLHTLSYSKSNVGQEKAGVEQFFGHSIRSSREHPERIPCCSVVHLFEGPPYERKPSVAKIISERICTENIDVQFRTNDNPDIHPAQPDELAAFLDEFDPVSGKTHWELRKDGLLLPIPMDFSDPQNSADKSNSAVTGNVWTRVTHAQQSTDEEDETLGEDDHSEGSEEFEAATLQETYTRTVKEIEKLLASNVPLCEFLLGACPQAIKRSASGGIVSDDVRSGRIDMCAVLEAIKNKLPAFSNNSADRTRLLEIVGGLFVFAVNPRWVLKQRALMRDKDIVFPGKHDTVPFKQAQSAALLPLLIAALADGFAHVEKIFGKPSARQLTVDPPRVARGILKQDKRTELQLHFIDYLLKPGDEVDRSDPTDIAEVFGRVCTMLRYADEKERVPYYTSNRSYAALSTIIREDLKMHLLLIFPSGEGVIDTLITDPVYLFSHASEIFQSITDSLTAS